MPRAVLYARVSTQRQASADRFSLADQRANFTERCDERGYTPVGEYQDAESGRKDSRAEYQRMLADAAAKRFDVIVVTFLDRFGRRDEEIAFRVLELRRMGVTVDATRERTEAFIDLFLSAWKAGQDSERIAARVRSTMAVAARGGGVTGVPAYGYRVSNKRYVVEPFEAEVVRGIFRAYTVENRSQLQIAADLNARDVPSARRRAWTANTVGQILTRSLYAGSGTWGGEAVQRPAIIDVATFDAARARAAVKRTLPAGRTQTSGYLLSGLIWCARCGGRMIGHRSQGDDLTYRGYVCAEHRRHGKCSLNWHRADVLEGAVLASLDSVLGDTTEAHQRAHNEAERLEGLLVGVEASMSRIERRYADAFAAFERGEFVVEGAFRGANERIAADQAQLERERERLRDEIARARLAADSVETMHRVRSASASFEAMPLSERKAALQQIIARVECDARSAPLVTLRY